MEEKCLSCNLPLAPGKKFCGACGKPVASHQHAQTSNGNNPNCAKCSAPLAPGIKFCLRCGASTAQGHTLEDARRPQMNLCSHCQSPLAPGKHFCAKCGNPVESSRPDSPRVIDNAISENTSQTAAIPAAVEPSSLQGQAGVQRQQSQDNGKKMRARIALPIAAAIALAAMTAGGIWYWRVHRFTPTTQTQPTTNSIALPAQTTSQPVQTQQLDSAAPAPAPSTQETSTAESSASLTQDQQVSSNPVPAAADNHNVSTAAAAPIPMPPTTPTGTKPPSSGDFHYQGPPISHGQTIVFGPLPAARVKLTYDHSLWQVILKTNPDGTKNAILISLAPYEQSNCDMHWDLIQ